MTFDTTHEAPHGGDKHSSKMEKQQPTARDIARDCYRDADGDLKKATRAMRRKLSRNPKLMTLLIEEFIESACDLAVRYEQQQKRRQTWLPPNYDPGGNGERVAALASATRSMLMDFPLPHSGVKLGDATLSEILEASSFYVSQGKDMLAKGRWLSMIGEKLVQAKTDKDATPREVLNEKTLAELQKEAING